MTEQASTAKTTWAIDNSHSHIQFKIKHLMISTVTGSFNKFNATVETQNEDFGKASIQFSADVASIHTGDAQRDGHLLSADFFDAEKYPTISFRSTGLEEDASGNYLLNGDLEIKGEIKPIQLKVSFEGIAKDPWGNTKAGFNLEGSISRKDWGLTWNAPLEAGGFLVSDEVKINCEVQLMKQS
ncbi:MAG: YceI family protein [Sphingomonadales bacterium]|jgi:polyisoprenoid-binding protein YceI